MVTAVGFIHTASHKASYVAISQKEHDLLIARIFISKKHTPFLLSNLAFSDIGVPLLISLTLAMLTFLCLDPCCYSFYLECSFQPVQLLQSPPQMYISFEVF